MEPQDFPSEHFDNIYGTSLSHKWHMPQGWDEHSIGDQLVKGTKKSKKLVEEILKLNPELMTIRPKDSTVGHIIWGVVSRYNYDDIKFFVEEWIDLRAKRVLIQEDDNHEDDNDELEKYFQKIKLLETKSKCGIQWIPSPETYTKIENALKL
jgi:hypothetical protein